MPIGDAPAGQPHFDVRHVGLVVTVAIGDEEEIRGRAEEQSIESHGDRRRKRDALEEHLAAVGHAVAVGVFEDHDAAVAGIRKALRARFVVAVFSHPQPPAVVPAEGHRLRDHRFARPRVDLVAGNRGHVRRGLLRREERRGAPFLLRDAPQRGGRIRRSVAAVLRPRIGHLDVVQRAGVDDEAVADDFGLVGGDGPVGGARARGADAELIVDAPGLRIAAVVGMVEDRDVRAIVAAGDLHRDVDPHGALAFGARVALAGGVDDLAVDALAPRHAEEQAAVVVLADGDVAARFAAPGQVEEEAAVLLAHRPALGLGEDRRAVLVDEVVDRLPAHLVARRLEHGHGDAAPVVGAAIVEVIAAVQAGESPVEPGLVRMVRGIGLGEDAAAVGRRDRVQVRPPVRRRVLRDHRGRASGPGHGDGSSLSVVPRDQPLCRRWTAARLLVPALQRRRGRRHCRDGDDDGEGDEASLVGHGLHQADPSLRGLRGLRGLRYGGYGVGGTEDTEAPDLKTEQRSQRRERRRYPSARRYRGYGGPPHRVRRGPAAKRPAGVE